MICVQTLVVGSAVGVGSMVGLRMEQSGVKDSSCPVSPGCPEGSGCPDCSGRPRGPEVVDFFRVGRVVSSVIVLFCSLLLAHSSKLCVSANQTASSLR